MGAKIFFMNRNHEDGFPLGLTDESLVSHEEEQKSESIKSLFLSEGRSVSASSQSLQESSEKTMIAERPKGSPQESQLSALQTQPFAVLALGQEINYIKPTGRDHALFRFIWAQLQYEFRQRLLAGVAQSGHFKRTRTEYYQHLRESCFTHIDHYVQNLPPGIIRSTAMTFRRFLNENIFDGYLFQDKGTREGLEKKLDEAIALISPEKIFRPGSIEKVGQGAFGVVYAAEFSSTGEKVALKLTLPQRQSALARLYEEVFHLLELRETQPVMETYAAFRTPTDIPGIPGSKNHVVIVSEFVEGKSLTDAMNEQLEKPQEERLNWSMKVLIGICEALDQVHKRGVFHRDLKPENIKIEPGGTVRLLDFGLSTKLGSSSTDEESQDDYREISSPDGEMSSWIDPRSTCATKSATKGAIGTPHYMSPENLPGTQYHESSDAWAAMLIFLEASTGHRVYAGFRKNVLMSFLKAIQNGENRMVPYVLAQYEDFFASIPSVVKSVIIKAFDPRIETRLSPQEIAQTLRIVQLLQVSDDERPQRLMEYAAARIRAGILPQEVEHIRGEECHLLLDMQHALFARNEELLGDFSLKKVQQLLALLDELIISSFLEVPAEEDL